MALAVVCERPIDHDFGGEVKRKGLGQKPIDRRGGADSGDDDDDEEDDDYYDD